jgi:hypothetical protein
MDDLIDRLASAGHVLPENTMRWAIQHWDQAAPALLDAIEALADGRDRSDRAGSVVFFALFLAAERREALLSRRSAGWPRTGTSWKRRWATGSRRGSRASSPARSMAISTG